MYLGTLYSFTEFRPYRISNMAQSDLKYGHQVAILEKQLSAVTPELMPVSSQNFNHRFCYR
jgi:hypothetical protein